MEEDIKNLVYNLLCDLKKKEIEPVGRARLIQSYMDETGMTGRQFAKSLGIPHSTLQDWLRWNKITKNEYEEYVDKGYTHKDIYKSLRGGSLANKKAIDQVLENCISKLEVFKLSPPYSNDTKVLLAKLKRIIIVIESQVK